MTNKRVIILILDAVGIGETYDADAYNDNGAATLQNCANAVGGLTMPTCQSLGLGNIAKIKGIAPVEKPKASYGKMSPRSVGKDSTTGHWEIAGVVVDKPFPLYPDGFPIDLIKKFEQKANVKTTYNLPASGTEIIEKLGQHHLETKELILYTSGDSVFQLAAHEDIFPIKRLYQICQIAREMLTGEHAVGRVIARPFAGTVGNFSRTTNRKDFSLEPSGKTILDIFIENDLKTLAIGKINDLFAGRGITGSIKTKSNDDGMDTIINVLKNDREHDLIFANLIDCDQLWGHRRDPINFAASLEQFDRRLSELLPALRDNDILFISADHGCDPTFKNHTDHTREFVPLLVYGKSLTTNSALGTRDTFADIAKTIAAWYGFDNSFLGKSFLKEISND